MKRSLALCFTAASTMLNPRAAEIASAQVSNNNPTFVVVAPVVNATDENNVSMMSGKLEINIPMLTMGPLKYVEYHITGIDSASLNDTNTGRVVPCLSVSANAGYSGSGECASAIQAPRTIQTVYGAERASFQIINGQYQAAQGTGETFTNNQNGFCTWTRKDGTQILFHAYQSSDSPVVCLSQNIAKIIQPDGRTLDYYYYGAISTTGPNPILAIASSDGYILKYNYPGTPVRGGYTSVVAINRSFQACDPMAFSCAATGWPTASFTTQIKTMPVSDNFPPLGSGYSGLRHYLVTLTDAQQKSHVFETDSYHRVVTYQPPGAEAPLTRYTMCALLTDPNPSDVSWPMQNCFGQTNWRLDASADQAPSMFDTVESVTRNGQTWSYGRFPTGPEQYPPFNRWTHGALSPLGLSLIATGNSTPGMEYIVGPTQKVTNRDGSYLEFQASIANPVIRQVDADGAITTFGYDGRNNVTTVTQNPSSGSAPPLVRTASYPTSCTTLLTCNKPDYVIDANGNRTDYSYDSQHGGVLTETGPAVNGIRPQKRYTYVQRYAWYLNAGGAMTRDARPVWLLASESYCRTGASSGSGCAIAGDEVLTTYDYGPDSGPNNLLLRGVSIMADGRTLRTCYGHDRYGHKIWERSPNAGMTSCPAY